MYVYVFFEKKLIIMNKYLKKKRLEVVILENLISIS